MTANTSQITESQWVTFPGGELEGRRPKALCPECRERLRLAAASGRAWARKHPLCFQCYRAEIARERALIAAGELDTASVERFQSALPFESVNGPRLEMLKAERGQSRAAMAQGVDRFVDKRRRAQIAARHALQVVAAGIPARRSDELGVAAGKAERRPLTSDERDRAMWFAIHAAEIQLPESWMPFVVSR